MNLLKNVIYINLESRTDRNAHVLIELAKLGVNPVRMNAVRTTSGAVGCSLSHIKCLEYAKKENFDHVFICEDDITFLNPILLLENIKKMENNKDIDWDVLIIGGNNSPRYEKITDYCIRVYNNQTTTGYIVRSHYYDTLITNIKESVKKLMVNPDNIHNRREHAIDMYWKRLQLSGKWYMIIPPTVIQYEDYSDIEGHVVNYNSLMLDIDKDWLFKPSTLQNIQPIQPIQPLHISNIQTPTPLILSNATMPSQNTMTLVTTSEGGILNMQKCKSVKMQIN